jgi:hypothetical protein
MKLQSQMPTKGKRNLYLYLAIACLIGIIAIFVIDGYLGIYDTIYITTGEEERTVEPEYWLRPYGEAYHIGANWNEQVFFRYELDNRRFSSYSTSIQASVWKENEKVLDLFSQAKLMIKPFDKAMVEWALDSKKLQAQGFYAGDYSEYTVKIEHNGVERRIIVSYHGSSPKQPYPEYPSES